MGAHAMTDEKETVVRIDVKEMVNAGVTKETVEQTEETIEGTEQ